MEGGFKMIVIIIVTLYMMLLNVHLQKKVLIVLRMGEKIEVIQNGDGSLIIVIFRGLMRVEYSNNFVGKEWFLLVIH
jgi:hypothetical protein